MAVEAKRLFTDKIEFTGFISDTQEYVAFVETRDYLLFYSATGTNNLNTSSISIFQRINNNRLAQKFTVNIPYTITVGEVEYKRDSKIYPIGTKNHIIVIYTSTTTCLVKCFNITETGLIELNSYTLPCTTASQFNYIHVEQYKEDVIVCCNYNTGAGIYYSKISDEGLSPFQTLKAQSGDYKLTPIALIYNDKQCYIGFWTEGSYSNLGLYKVDLSTLSIDSTTSGVLDCNAYSNTSGVTLYERIGLRTSQYRICTFFYSSSGSGGSVFNYIDKEGNITVLKYSVLYNDGRITYLSNQIKGYDLIYAPYLQTRIVSNYDEGIIPLKPIGFPYSAAQFNGVNYNTNIGDSIYYLGDNLLMKLLYLPYQDTYKQLGYIVSPMHIEGNTAIIGSDNAPYITYTTPPNKKVQITSIHLGSSSPENFLMNNSLLIYADEELVTKLEFKGSKVMTFANCPLIFEPNTVIKIQMVWLYNDTTVTLYGLEEEV